ncbi:MAG TPA: FAD-dependent oxidoreductase [Oscillospiraceae bacterium]|nr:FAD-dependent oxidoreductase [Oscillospiraceae bacterium]HPF55951.1 FAD-dependent oxidoreductase [Clostridiales bacterium]HPK36168.1 FAD-dependent oxidoreductase [Oscillospiraceae bacterium]HPR76546.1 FAD-dependent oxidoreductase [Oscillospiraceae bacterium]
MKVERIKTDVAVVGAGMAGCGAAAVLAKSGLTAVVIEKQGRIGGTAVAAGVNNFEPGVSAGECHRLLAERLIAAGKGQVQESVKELPCAQTGEFWGLSVKSADGYEATLRRSGLTRGEWRRFVFDDEAMETELRNLIKSDRVTLLTDTEFADCDVRNHRIETIRCHRKDGTVLEITARRFIDAGGEIELARKSGCKATKLAESRDVYNEPSAPDQAAEKLNGVTYVFQLSKSLEKQLENPLSSFSDQTEQWLKEAKACGFCSFIVTKPDGDLNVNMLPTMAGDEYFADGEAARQNCLERVYRYAEYLTEHPAFKGYHLSKIFPFPGIREHWRLVGKTVLTQNDILIDFRKHPNRADFISIADHPMDIHGENGICAKVDNPYGIPYSCLLPNEISNLLVACRGASFSHLAASSCRLSRTMLSLGESAALAVIQAAERGIELENVNPEPIFEINIKDELIQ